MFRSFTSAMARRLGIKIAPPVRASVSARAASRFRPVLEQFEAREVPALFTWQGAFGTDATDYRNWEGGSPGVLPGAGDDVRFLPRPQAGTDEGTPAPVSVDCTGFALASGAFAAVSLGGGYTGTVSFASAIRTGTFTLMGGAIAQPVAGTDLTVTSAFLWTAGTLNSSANLATVTLDGATGTIAPAGGGTVQIGSNLALTSGASVNLQAGTMAYINSGAAISITSSTLNVDPGTNGEALIAKSNANVTDGPQVKINLNGWYKIVSGTHNSEGGVRNTGGSFLMNPGTLATYSGSANAPNNSQASFWQSAGAIYLGRGATLALGEGEDAFLMSGGLLSIQLNGGTGSSEIQGNAKIIGGEIKSGNNANGNTHLFGTLRFHGDVTWTGGTYRPFVDANSVAVSDVWFSTGTLTIGGTATLAPIGINAETNQPEIPAEYTSGWVIFEATGGIDADVGTPNLSDPWTLSKSRKKWQLNRG